MNDYVSLIIGVVCAGTGGELFVRGAVGIARWVRVTPGIIGATVAAFATSNPELSVAVNASLAGEPQVSLGNALGANIVNIALILGITLTISGIQSPRDSVKRDLPVALLVPAITGILLFDGLLSRFDGFLMLGIFFLWLAATVTEARKQRSTAVKVFGSHSLWYAPLFSVAGLAFLIVAGNLIVAGARGIAVRFGVDEFVIGATVVAVGTTIPELVTAVIAKLRGHDEVGLGTVLGSNIFNGLLIVAVAAIINPIQVGWRETVTALAFGLLAVLMTFPTRQGFIERRRGVLLLVLYTTYLAVALHGSA